MADPTGFEPASSSVTGWHVGPLHHGSATSRKDSTSSIAPSEATTRVDAQPRFVEMSLAHAAASGLQRIILDERTVVESRRWSGESALGCGHPAPVHKHEFEIPGGCPERMQAWLAGVRLGATFVRSQAARPRRAPVRAPRFVPNPSFGAAYGRVGPIQ